MYKFFYYSAAFGVEYFSHVIKILDLVVYQLISLEGLKLIKTVHTKSETEAFFHKISKNKNFEIQSHNFLFLILFFLEFSSEK